MMGAGVFALQWCEDVLCWCKCWNNCLCLLWPAVSVRINHLPVRQQTVCTPRHRPATEKISFITFHWYSRGCNEILYIILKMSPSLISYIWWFGVASPVTPPWHMSSFPPGHHTDFVWIENLSLTTNTTALTLSRGDHLLVKCPAQYHLSLSLVLSFDVFEEETRGKCLPWEIQRWSGYQVGGKEIWFAGSIESCECDVTGTQIKNILFLLYFDRQTP